MPVGIGGEDLAQAVHAVALFAGPIAKGMAAAQQLQEKLRAGSLAPYLDPKKFGKVHLETLSAPYLVSDRSCRGLAAAAYLATVYSSVRNISC
jgi:hypothetical protein